MEITHLRSDILPHSDDKFHYPKGLVLVQPVRPALPGIGFPRFAATSPVNDSHNDNQPRLDVVEEELGE